jgi:hypothetical protein
VNDFRQVHHVSATDWAADCLCSPYVVHVITQIQNQECQEIDGAVAEQAMGVGRNTQWEELASEVAKDSKSTETKRVEPSISSTATIEGAKREGSSFPGYGTIGKRINDRGETGYND